MSNRLFTEVRFTEAPPRVPLLPKPGTYQHGQYGDVALTRDRIANFVANINSSVYQRHIPIDAEHQSKLSGAIGYIDRAVVNADGSADALVNWEARGRSLIEGGGFRYVSPEWLDTWTDPATRTTHSDVVVGLAVTTRPFFKDNSLRPMVASEAGAAATTKRFSMDDATAQAEAELVAVKTVIDQRTAELSAAKGIPIHQAYTETIQADGNRLWKRLRVAEDVQGAAVQIFTAMTGAAPRQASATSAETATQAVIDARQHATKTPLERKIDKLAQPFADAHGIPLESAAEHIRRQNPDLQDEWLAEQASKLQNADPEAAIEQAAKGLSEWAGIDLGAAYVKAFAEPTLRHRLAVARRG